MGLFDQKPKEYRLNRKTSVLWAEESLHLDETSESTEKFLNSGISRQKITLMMTAMGFIFLLLIGRNAQLQVMKGDEYLALSDSNRVRVTKLMPKRGIIFDKNKIPLVENIPNFSLFIQPADLPAEHVERARVLAELSSMVQIPVDEIYAKLAEVPPSYPQQVLIRDNISYEDAILLTIKSKKLRGISFDLSYTRNYLALDEYGNAAAKTADDSLSHLMGYMGTVSAEEMKNIETENYLISDSIGKSGLEARYESLLRGRMGREETEVNAFGKGVTVIAKNEPRDGKNMYLTLDMYSQKKLEEIMKGVQTTTKLRGAAVALDPRTGGVIAMVSLPGFNNNDFARGISQERYQTLISDEAHPLFHRAISGTYPSGSTIKPTVAAYALEEKIITPNTTVISTGGIRINEWFYPDWKPGGHGAVNLNTAIAWSVNTYFYYLGGGYQDFQGLGRVRLAQGFSEFGLGKPTGIDLPHEAKGLVPTSEWKEKVKNEPWYVGDTYHMAIGQGDVLVTPIQMAAITAAFANGGTVFTPHLLDSVQDNDTAPIVPAESSGSKELPISKKNIEAVRYAMKSAVDWGASKRLRVLPVSSAAKTGTAQSQQNKPPHSWITIFAPYEQPVIAMSVIIEEGGEGGGAAHQIAQEFLQWYFSSASNQPR